jgi:nucleoside phosphorylase
MPVTGGRKGHARVAVLTAVHEETAQLRRVFGLTTRIPGTAYFVSPGSSFERPEVVHREIDRTNLISGERVTRVIEDWQPELLVMCGTAGGIDKREGIAVGDIVVPPYVHYYAFAKHTSHGTFRRYIPFDYPSINLHSDYVAPLRDDTSWITDELRESLPDGWEPKVLIDSIVVGDKLFGAPDSEEQREIVASYDDAVALDMESVGVCRGVAACRDNPQYNPRLLIIRCISDMINDPENDKSRDAARPHACSIASFFTKRVVDDILDWEPDPRPTSDGGE